MSERFKTIPGKVFLDSISDFLLDNYKFDQIKLILDCIPNEYDTVPSLKELKVFSAKIINNSVLKTKDIVKEKEWVSEIAPGTPPHLECVFVWIKEKKIGCKGWDVAIRHLNSSGVSEEDIWQMYEEWTNGKVHEKARRLKVKPMIGAL